MKVAAWFTPSRRKAAYGIVAFAGTVLLTAGIVAGPIDKWVIFGQSIVGLLFGAMATVAARRWDWSALYLITGVVGAAAGVSLVTADTAGVVEALIAQTVTILPPLLAALRTDTDTSTGEPVAEFAARRGLIGG